VIAPKLKLTCKKSLPGFWHLPPNRFGDRQNPFIQREKIGSVMQQGLLQIAVTLIILIAIAPVFGNYMARVYMGQKTILDLAIKPLE
jgi:hypothetical protein